MTNHNLVTVDMMKSEIGSAVAAADARAAQLQFDLNEAQINIRVMAEHNTKIVAERDTAWAELREIRTVINADNDEATSDEVRRVLSERDELRRQLEQAQKLIEELYTAWGDAPLMVGERDDRINAMTKAATIHYEAQL